MNKYKMAEKAVVDWDIEDVARWLDNNRLSDYKQLFCDKHKIDGSVLISLTEDDLRKPPVEITVLGDMKRISACIDKLRVNNETAYRQHQQNSDNDNDEKYIYENGKKLRYSQQSQQQFDEYDDEYDDKYSFTTDNTENIDRRKLSPLEEELKNAVVSEIFRTFCSVIYMLVVFFFSAYMLAVVHDRLPDMSNYPPLPDIFLENIPFMPWAFPVCEYCAGLLMGFWYILIIFHKHRLIILRRSCSIAGSIFLLRCFTMYVTSMSVPGKHLQCYPTKLGTFYNRANRALEIFGGFGMSLYGVRTCGDYMFSGHTAVLTLLNFFVTEYTPRRWYYLHIVSWMLNGFGIFFILAAHEHYSIDVLISFYISSRLFLYYHTLASSVQVRRSDEKRRRIWFPLFWFFEYRTPLVIQNEFEWPFTRENLAKLVSYFKPSSYNCTSTTSSTNCGEGEDDEESRKNE